MKKGECYPPMGVFFEKNVKKTIQRQFEMLPAPLTYVWTDFKILNNLCCITYKKIWIIQYFIYIFAFINNIVLFYNKPKF